jgi:hypothetical protein
MTPETILSNRVISAFPVSIGTALALESIFDGRLPPYDPSRPIPQKVDITKYGKHYFNLVTLIRNIIGAVSDIKPLVANSLPLADTLSEELNTIQDIYQEGSKGKCEPIFFIPDYSNLNKLGRDKIVFRIPKTDKQLMEHSLIQSTIKTLMVKNSSLIYNKPKLKGGRNVLITTHASVDLLNNKYFTKMDLLESHTGRLKTKKDWHTKYHPVGKAPKHMLPFIERLLYIFGDKSTIAPMSIKIRRDILDIATKTNWTPMTTEDKIKFYLKENKDIYKLYMTLPKLY